MRAIINMSVSETLSVDFLYSQDLDRIQPDQISRLIWEKAIPHII